MSNPTPTLERSRWSTQMSLDEVGRPLREVTFCVVDLETTGGSAQAGSMITEIGAVKVRGGEVLGEFQTLVNPRASIPSFIAVLTGISDSMVAQAPTIDLALPSFLEFARGSVLVAHNAPFDVGFLRHFAGQLDLVWPRFEVVDTARLARRVVTRDETPNCKLSSLARLFNATTVPNHRALSDARATVDVLHGLFARLGNLGVHTLEDLSDITAKVAPAQRRKRHLAAHLPNAPGVYLFKDASDRVLYVGTSKDLRTRVRSYFTKSETRSRIGEMIAVAHSVEGIVCASALEASVRELRLIAAHKPPYNKRSKYPEKARWLKLTNEPWPRLSLVNAVREDGGDYLGPFRSRRAAEVVARALHETFLLRQCTQRLPQQPKATPCVLAELSQCLSPCDGSASSVAYAEAVRGARQAFIGSPSVVLDTARARLDRLAAQQRFEEATRQRDRASLFVTAASRTQRLAGVVTCAELVAARREPGIGWVVHVVRRGRLSAAGVIPPGAEAQTYVASLRASAETVISSSAPAASAEETERILTWLETPGTRVVHVEGEWSYPINSAIRIAAAGAIECLRNPATAPTGTR